MAQSSAYNPSEWEGDLSKAWRKAKIGTPEVQVKQQELDSDAQTYTIIMPPPNLTGSLHAGHTLNHFLMDTLARIHRQRGYKTLVYPGVDHAGLQMEGVINKYLASQGIDRKTMSTAEYLKVCWQKSKEWRNGQSEQAYLIGTSADYTRELFTLDERATNMVMHAFKQYYRDGLIYKSSYIVNWSVGLQTALSDVSGEIIYETKKDPLVTFQYGTAEVAVGTGGEELAQLAPKIQKALDKNPITVSTVRPETIFGDVAIAVHPTRFREKLRKALDSRQIDQVVDALEKGDLVITQNLPEFEVSCRLLLSDKVEAEFGTGALKVTPGSDLFDYELYTNDFSQYALPGYKQVITREGTLSDEVPVKYRGMTREEARVESIKLLIQSGLVAQQAEPAKNIPKEYTKVKDIETYAVEWDYEHNVSLCERTKTVIEPLVSEEFYLSYHRSTSRDGKSLRDLAKIGVAQTNFYPVDFRSQADNFLDGIKDWCISRDLVWGHRIPVWYNLELNPARKFYEPNVEQVEVDGAVHPIAQLLRVQVAKPVEAGEWVQEEKILDTWFSSSLWPLTTLGYYETNPKIQAIVTDVSGVFWDEQNKERERVVTFLQHAKEAGIAIYYLSNMNNKAMVDAFEATPHFGLFDGGVSAFESGQSKKSLEIYNLLLRKYDLDAAKVLYVDDVSEHISQGKEVGMQSYWYTPETDLFEVLNTALSNTNSDFDTFYPTDYMNTAKEIFYLWIVRMIMLGTYFTGTTPFKNVFITPTVLDGAGKKMSKSLGNGLQPEDAIAAYSSDALRMGMLSGVLPNRNMRFGGDVADKIMERMRNFGNKLWNLSNFFAYKAEQGADFSTDAEVSSATEWMQVKIAAMLDTINGVVNGYEFVPVIDSIIDTVWYSFADVYVEYLKTDDSQLGHAKNMFESIVTILHPFLPFETEALAQTMFNKKSITLAELDLGWVSTIPQNAGEEFSEVVQFSEAVRSLKGMYGIKPTDTVHIASNSPLVEKYAKFLKLVCKADLTESQDNWLSVQSGDIEYSVSVSEYISDPKSEIVKSEKDIDSLSKMVTSLEARLSNEKFLASADTEVVSQSKSDLEENKKSIEQLKAKIIYLHKLSS